MGLANGQYKRFFIIHSLNIHGIEVFRQMAKKTVTYIIRHREIPIYITNKPSEANPDTNYSTNRSRAREFDGMEEAKINMDHHIAIKKTVTEITEYEEVQDD